MKSAIKPIFNNSYSIFYLDEGDLWNKIDIPEQKNTQIIYYTISILDVDNQYYFCDVEQK